MGILADRFRAHLEHLKELDRRHQQSIDELIQDTRKLLAECEQITDSEE